ncbi:MAG: hypothetical protein IPK66_18585 [Rhodospirillales bacterium]|nr:hypothetical protein [Rhodospirillales bacterium]
MKKNVYYKAAVEYSYTLRPTCNCIAAVSAPGKWLSLFVDYFQPTTREAITYNVHWLAFLREGEHSPTHPETQNVRFMALLLMHEIINDKQP